MQEKIKSLTEQCNRAGFNVLESDFYRIIEPDRPKTKKEIPALFGIKQKRWSELLGKRKIK